LNENTNCHLPAVGTNDSPEFRSVNNYHRPPDACQVCGCPADTPGWLRNPNGGGLAALIPCPACNATKQAERAKVQHQLEGQLKNKTFANFHATNASQEAYDAARSFVSHCTSWLTLWGPYGDGKTHLLAAITNACTGAKYFTMPDLMSRYRHAVGGDRVEDFYQMISRIPVLVVDEIDKASLKDWTREQTFRLFDYRYRNLDTLGTVLAMNDSPDDVNDNLGYLFSRMKDGRCRVVFVGADDNRGKQGFLGKLAETKKAA
jgi:DNA replication protein DnaC